MRFLTILLVSFVSLLALNTFANGQDNQPADGEREVTLIKFATFNDNIEVGNPTAPEGVEGATDTATNPVLKKEDMALVHWRVVQNASATSPITMRESVTQKTADFLGVKIMWPRHCYDAHAIIEPTFPILAFDEKGQVINSPDKQTGVIRNVGKLKHIKVRVAGRGYRNGLSVRLRNEQGKIFHFFLGYLDFIGWKELKWENPIYNPTVDPLRIAKSPIYPLHEPTLFFDSFVIHRYSGGYPEDFVVYFDYVKVNYDLLISPETTKRLGPENDEEAWGYQTELFMKQAKKTQEFAAEHLRLYTDEKSRKGNNFVEDQEFIKEGVDTSGDTTNQ